MNTGELITLMKLIEGDFSNSPKKDPEAMLAVANMAIRKICTELRPVSYCARNADAIDAPTDIDNVLRQTVFSIDLSNATDDQAANQTYLGMKTVLYTHTENDESYDLVPVAHSETLYPRSELLESAAEDMTPTHYSVVPRSKYQFNIHLFPAPNGIPEKALEVWYYAIPGPLTNASTQELEISDQYVDLIIFFAKYAFSGFKYEVGNEFRKELRNHRQRTQTEGNLSKRALTGL